jgi:two-component system, CitB family, sensor kinase
MSAAWRSRLRWPRWTLAGRMLAMQLAIMCVVLVGVALVSIAQSDARFKDTEGRRALAIAENLADSSGVQKAVGPPSPETPGFIRQAQDTAEFGRSFSDSTKVMVVRADRRVVASTDPLPTNRIVRMQAQPAYLGRAWVGTEEETGDAMATAPVINEATLATDGVVVVTRAYPTVAENLAAAMPNLLTYLGIATALGVVGSFLLSRRVKRQTLGLEPREITGLVEQREAILHGIKEGMLAVGLDRRITMVNDEAAHLLGISQTSTGRHVAEVDLTGRLADIFAGPDSTTDRVIPYRGRVLTLNRMPVLSRGRHIGWVVTLRDRTELLELQRELDLTRDTTDALRAQAHEFSNRMHVVSGLIELGEYDEARGYVRHITESQTRLTTSITSHVADPAVAALLIAKSSQADERDVDLVLEDTTHVGRLDERLAADVNTVLGNLIDNALDASGRTDANGASRTEPVVTVEVLQTERDVRITVRDTGPGVDTDLGDRVFRPGVSTKEGGPDGRRGVGLALVRVICRKRGGDVTVRHDKGAVFVATLPLDRTAVAP